MKITVLTPTCRYYEHLAEQIEALNVQTLQDFEWIVVDDFHKERKGTFKELVKDKFPLIHIPPREIVPYSAIAMAFNTGLIYAQGELVYLMNDYVIPEPSCLERHWEIYHKYKKVMISGQIRGLHDYRESYTENQIEEGLYEVFRELCHGWWAGRNDSVSLEALLECNGFEEFLDGQHSMQDAELAERLLTYGVRFFIDKLSWCKEYEHTYNKAGKPHPYGNSYNAQVKKLIEDKVAKQECRTNLDRNLREERWAILHQL